MPMQSSLLAAGLMIPKHLWFIPPLKQEDVPSESASSRALCHGPRVCRNPEQIISALVVLWRTDISAAFQTSITSLKTKHTPAEHHWEIFWHFILTFICCKFSILFTSHIYRKTQSVKHAEVTLRCHCMHTQLTLNITGKRRSKYIGKLFALLHQRANL